LSIYNNFDCGIVFKLLFFTRTSSLNNKIY
jgi:hypothetical protein